MENFGLLKVGEFILKMDAPNAPNPANPKCSGSAGLGVKIKSL